jgi:hypothetical protein
VEESVTPDIEEQHCLPPRRLLFEAYTPLAQDQCIDAIRAFVRAKLRQAPIGGGGLITMCGIEHVITYLVPPPGDVVRVGLITRADFERWIVPDFPGLDRWLRVE